MKVKLCFSMIMFSLALTIFGASKNVSAQAQGHVTQYLYLSLIHISEPTRH